MDRPEVRQYINYLHDRFVIIPVDKASDDFGIVCKSCYLDVIKTELGISDDGNIIGNTVYKPIYQKVNDIYTFHEENVRVHLVWSYSTSIIVYLYFIRLQNNINAHTNSGLLQVHENVMINNLQ